MLEPFLLDSDTSLSVCGMNYRRIKTKTNQSVYINPLREPHRQESKKAYILYLLTIDGRLYSSVNKLYQSKAIKAISFDESLNFAEDTKFVLDYLKKTQGKIKFILKPLYIYNFGTETSTVNKAAIIWQNWQQSYDNLLKWVGPNPDLKESFWLKMILLRWRISYIRSKRRAKQ